MIFAGHYIYLEASGIEPGQEFRTYSPDCSTYGSSPYRISFWYHMFGANMGGLRLYEVYKDLTINPTPIWSISGGVYTGKKMLCSLL